MRITYKVNQIFDACIQNLYHNHCAMGSPALSLSIKLSISIRWFVCLFIRLALVGCCIVYRHHHHMIHVIFCRKPNEWNKCNLPRPNHLKFVQLWRCAQAHTIYFQFFFLEANHFRISYIATYRCNW